jgi:hypothetical protein
MGSPLPLSDFLLWHSLAGRQPRRGPFALTRVGHVFEVQVQRVEEGAAVRAAFGEGRPVQRPPRSLSPGGRGEPGGAGGGGSEGGRAGSTRQGEGHDRLAAVRSTRSLANLGTPGPPHHMPR